MSMKSFLKRATGFDRAVYWPPLTSGGVRQVDNFGQFKSGAAVEVQCRWEDVQEDFIDREGKVELSKAKVFLIVPVEFGGILWHGRLANVTDAVVPLNNVGALEIRQILATPSFHNTAMLTTVIL